MEANRGQGGIQQLLAAEQKAQHIVNAARNAKMARLKQAKEEADKEIAEFRAQMEREFQKKVAESSGDSGANVQRLEQETEAKINHLKLDAATISSDVVNMLLNGLLDLNYACHASRSCCLNSHSTGPTGQFTFPGDPKTWKSAEIEYPMIENI
ncbi:hypothetical protein NE237_008776 [Protea cynaroides]|uniref:V-type proton ATPase subunit G n=1 Tax=Protea cynaroides TaxID=273540 RepID=A0A9Q0KWI5_9MAGN|nr:hypothetical protein NE237_008776 [Protea cynaroides]